MTRSDFDKRLRRLEHVTPTVRSGDLTEDDLVAAVQAIAVTPSHIEAFHRLIGQEMHDYICGMAYAMRNARAKGQSYSSSLLFPSEYAAELVSHPPGETPHRELAATVNRSANLGRFFGPNPLKQTFDKDLFSLRYWIEGALARRILKTPDAIELRTEVHRHYDEGSYPWRCRREFLTGSPVYRFIRPTTRAKGEPVTLEMLQAAEIITPVYDDDDFALVNNCDHLDCDRDAPCLLAP
jgi:hypothetical protein